MKTTSISGWLISLAVLSLVLSSVLVYATDICHEHTGNGTDADQFYPAANEDLYLDAKAPASGSLSAYVTVQSPPGFAGRVDVHNGQRDGIVIDSEDLGATCIFTSRCSGYVSGTGYAQLSTVGGKKGDCIPSGTPH
ncbi:hypothetical protein KKG66_08620 [bacterium]|nr:hypothetical protein [bacterium]